jgi:NADH:ubiquinone oxidoreductase subunit 6 (subunit J)
MLFAFVMIAGLILASALAAVLLRKVVHSILCLTITFLGIAAIYLQLQAEFIGFAQILVYVGAVAILIAFALLLTRNAEPGPDHALASASWLTGAACAFLVLGCLVICILASQLPGQLPAPPVVRPEVTVKKIGLTLMQDYVLPLELMGLLLTSALMGAVVLAQEERESDGDKSLPRT